MSELRSESHAADEQKQVFQTVVNAKTIQTAAALVDALFEECHVYFDGDGVRMSAIDAATVASVDLMLERAAFEAYEATDGHVGVDLARLRDVVRMADRGQPVELTIDSETRKLEIRIDGLEYALALLDPETVRSLPDWSSLDLEFAGGVVTEAEAVDRAVRAADMVSDHVALEIDETEEVFYVEAEGDTDDVSLALPADDLVELTPGEARSLFSIDYLTAINRAMPGDIEVDLQLGTDHPLAIRYEFAEGGGSVEYLVSPRISSY